MVEIIRNLVFQKIDTNNDLLSIQPRDQSFFFYSAVDHINISTYN